MSFPGDPGGKESACNAGDPGQSLGWEDPLEKGMAVQREGKTELVRVWGRRSVAPALLMS